MSALIRAIHISSKNESFRALPNTLFCYTQDQRQTPSSSVCVCNKNTAPHRYFDVTVYYIQTCLGSDQANVGRKNVGALLNTEERQVCLFCLTSASSSLPLICVR